jgi:hypothetical protein
VRLPNAAHTARPWRIDGVVPDFRLEDVWALPTPGGPGDFRRLVDIVTSLDPARSSSPVVRLLFIVRERLGQLLGWDQPEHGVGGRVPTLAERLPDDLRATAAAAPALPPFRSLYLLDDEFAAEAANDTMHGVLHLGWVRGDDGSYRGELAIYVKPNGRLGEAYMAAIKPFRHLLVYPQLQRAIGRAWAAGG